MWLWLWINCAKGIWVYRFETNYGYVEKRLPFSKGIKEIKKVVWEIKFYLAVTFYEYLRLIFQTCFYVPAFFKTIMGAGFRAGSRVSRSRIYIQSKSNGNGNKYTWQEPRFENAKWTWHQESQPSLTRFLQIDLIRIFLKRQVVFALPFFMRC